MILFNEISYAIQFEGEKSHNPYKYEINLRME